MILLQSTAAVAWVRGSGRARFCSGIEKANLLPTKMTVKNVRTNGRIVETVVSVYAIGFSRMMTMT